MEKRVILALILSALVFLIYSFWVYKQETPSTLPIEPKPAPPIQEAPVKEESVQRPLTPLPFRDLKEKEITIETDHYSALFSTKGGVIKSWKLKKYKVENNSGEIQLLANGPSEYPLTLSSPEQSIRGFIEGVIYTSSKGNVTLSSENKTETISLTYDEPSLGIKIEKRLTFHNDDYAVDLTIHTEGISTYAISLGENFGVLEKANEAVYGFRGPISLIGNRLIKDKIEKLEGEITHDGQVQWIALEDKYFISSIIPKTLEKSVVIKKIGEDKVSTSIRINAADTKEKSFILYAGPKEFDRLSNLKVGLEQTVEFGWFSFFAKPLFRILKFIYRVTGNYGVAIILLTVLVKVIFIPLTYKSYKSMKEMQALQPEIAKLQKKYKDDKTKLNMELMGLYKKHKVNPLGGCLPILLQIPVFIALYYVLLNAIELRHAPFILWVQDLSAKDPYYILPIVMGATWFLQQWMTPTAGDPLQAKMMLIMPIIFTFLFLQFPSGLVLYWLVNNVLSILQQVITVRLTKTAVGVASESVR